MFFGGIDLKNHAFTKVVRLSVLPIMVFVSSFCLSTSGLLPFHNFDVLLFAQVLHRWKQNGERKLVSVCIQPVHLGHRVKYF